MPRVRTQLAIQATPDLLARVKGAATARGQTVTRLLIDWIEAGLAGDLPAPAAGPDLLARVEALEAAMALLQPRTVAVQVSKEEQQPRTVAVQVSKEEQQPRTVAVRRIENPESSPPLPMGAGTIEIIGASHLRPAATAAAPAAGAITTAELAERTGTNRAAWNNWAAKSSPGDVRDHPQAGGWRLIGKVAAESGGPPRWLWEQA